VHILVTGGSGFIGAEVVKAYRDRAESSEGWRAHLRRSAAAPSERVRYRSALRSGTCARFSATGQIWCDLVRQWKRAFWAEEHGQIISGLGPFLERRAIERQALSDPTSAWGRSASAWDVIQRLKKLMPWSIAWPTFSLPGRT